MQLSKSAHIILEKSQLPLILCKLVGEFAGTDVALLRGDSFFELERGGTTFVALDEKRYVLGDNIHVHQWLVKRRTPKSYVIQYKDTVVVCENGWACYKYNAVSKKLEGKEKRIFPFRRKLKNDQKNVVSNIIERNYQSLPPNVKVVPISHNFFVQF